jgi:hypothetical protein
MEDKEFKSQDFYLCACLLAAGLALKRLESENSKLITFVFDNPNQVAQKIITDHWNRQFKIPSRNLIEAIHELKTRLHSNI